MVRAHKAYYRQLCEIAASRGGRVISEEYKGALIKMEFEDASGKRFWLRPSQVRQGQWSPRQIITDPREQLARLAEHAARRGGKLISTEYLRGDSKLEFEDAARNRFWMQPIHVLKGHWSPYEAKVVRDPEYHLSELRRIAEARGGRLISTNYVNWRTPLEFEDSAGNRFWSIPNNVKKGQWSPHEGTVSEHVCRQAMEHLFGVPFPSRWDVVRRPNGNKLQLDGYNEELKVGFEYQGYLHAKRADIMARDSDKRAACKIAGITLIEVSEFDLSQKYEGGYVTAHVAAAVRCAFAAAGYPEPKLNEVGFSADLTRINHCLRHHTELAKIAEARGGKLLSVAYVNEATKLEFQDAAGNRFHLSPTSVKQGQWSPYESNRVYDSSYHLAELKRIAERRGGRVVSTEYRRAHIKMEFEDVSGNRFWAIPNSVKRGPWSPYESKFKGAIVKIVENQRTVHLASGARVVYDILPDASLRIREAISADGLTKRRWAWDRRDGPAIVHYTRPSVDLPFMATGASALDGSAVPVRGVEPAPDGADRSPEHTGRRPA